MPNFWLLNSIPPTCHIFHLRIAGYLIVPYFLRSYDYRDNSSYTLEASALNISTIKVVTPLRVTNLIGTCIKGQVDEYTRQGIQMSLEIKDRVRRWRVCERGGEESH